WRTGLQLTAKTLNLSFREAGKDLQACSCDRLLTFLQHVYRRRHVSPLNDFNCAVSPDALSNQHSGERLQENFDRTRQRRLVEFDIQGAILIIETHVT